MEKNQRRVLIGDTTQLSSPVKAALREGLIKVNERMSRNLIGRLAISDTVFVAKLNASPFGQLIIQLYAPTVQSKNSAVEKYDEEFGEAMKQSKS